jgi:GDP-D-mannose 3', 5'-epimerase
MSERRAVVCGAGGLVGGHLATRLVEDGYRVRAVDRQYPYGEPPAHEVVVADLLDPGQCRAVLDGGTDEVYQLAAEMGGMEYITSAEWQIVHHSSLVNQHVLDAAGRAGVDRYFFSSSVCVYRDMAIGEDVLAEDGAYPAAPDNEYGWEKLFTERSVYIAAREFGFAPRIARFENCYGPRGAWRGGREKAPAALCRKIAQAEDGGSIEVFGGGTTVRSFVYVKDLVQGVRCLVSSDEERPTNIGVDEAVTIAELVELIADIAGKRISIVDVPGPLGVQSRNFSHQRIQDLGWKPDYTLRAGLEETYAWIQAQIELG